MSIAVPTALVSHFGKTRLKRSLGTDSLVIANHIKLPVVAELRAEIEAARAHSPQSPLSRHAAALAIALRRVGGDDARREQLHVEIGEEPDGDERDHLDASPQQHCAPARDIEAHSVAAARPGRMTPIELHHRAYLDQQATTRRTKTDDERALAYLVGWLKLHSLPASTEAMTKRRAGQFMDDLPNMGGKRSPTTLNKYLSRLSVYWQWLVKRDIATANVWQGMVLKEPKRLRSEEERPFTTDELKRLLKGPTTQAMHDLMRIAALTGARLDPIVDLKVQDCEGGTFRFKPQKAETDGRDVPIHSALTEIVARRVAGKAPDADLFPEWPAPQKADSHRERSFKASNAFTSYRREIGVTDEVEGRRRSLVNFHSFRRTFITMAEQAGIPESTIKSVVGHKRDGMTFGVYSRGPSMDQLRACVEALKLPEVDGVRVLPEKVRKVRGRRTPPGKQRG